MDVFIEGYDKLKMIKMPIPPELVKYVITFEKLSYAAEKQGLTQIIELWSEECGHCTKQFKYWSRPYSHEQDNEGLGVDVFEYQKYIKIANQSPDAESAWKAYKDVSGKLTKQGLDICSTIIDRILPIEIHTEEGERLIAEAASMADKVAASGSKILDKPDDYKIKFTPTWIDYETHQNYGHGHHSERQIFDMLDINSLKSRRKRFQALHSQELSQECDAVACGLDSQIKKIDTKKASRKRAN